MEEYTQITLDEWTSWKEDIRRKLAETANNFVYIGYRLKQIRDSGMYDGAADVFEFAQKEYGLGKSTVSRFIAINEKYSEGGNSLELKEEFRQFSSSKLAEMLTLPDNEIELITEKTTIKEIRELKNFNNQEPEQQGEQEETWTPLEKCLIDFFRTRKEVLNGVMEHLDADPPEYKAAAEQMAPSGQASHRKGIVFLFLYDWNTGVKYKIMTQPEPVSMTWEELLNMIYHIFGFSDQRDVWKDFYKAEEEPEKEHQKEEEKKAVAPQSNQGNTGSVATSQQKQKKEEKEQEKTEEKNGKISQEEENEQEEPERESGGAAPESERGKFENQNTVEEQRQDQGGQAEEQPGSSLAGGTTEYLTEEERNNIWKIVDEAHDAIGDFIADWYMEKPGDREGLKKAYKAAIDLAAGIERMLVEKEREEKQV